MEEVSLDTLHTMIKEQGAVLPLIEAIFLIPEFIYSSADTEFRGR